LFDKYRSLTQSSASKRQQKPSSNTHHLFQPKPSRPRSLPTTAEPNGTFRKAVCPKQLLDIVEVL